MFFPYLMPEWIYLKYFKFFKMAAIWGFGRVFKSEIVMEVESNIKIDYAIPYMLSFCSTF